MSQIKKSDALYYTPFYGSYKITQDYKKGKLSFQEAVAITISAASVSGIQAGMMLNVDKGSLLLAKAMPTFAASVVPTAAAVTVGAAVLATSAVYEQKVMSKARGKSGLKVTPFGGQGFGSVV